MVGYQGKPPPAQFNMARYCLQRSAAALASKAALEVLDDPKASAPAERWTYRDLEDAVLRSAAGLLARGLERGDRLLIRLPNTSDYAIAFFACLAAGIVPIAASSQLSAREASFLANDSGARAIVLHPDLPMGPLDGAPLIIEAGEVDALKHHADRTDYADTAADDPAFLIYTSGTSSNPKGVLHAQRSAWGRRPMYQGWYGLTPEDRVLHAGAFNWTYTLGTGLTDPWANGATALVYTGPKDPSAWPELIARHEATIFASVPALYRQILKYASLKPSSIPSLRHGLVAGETLPAQLVEDWRARSGTELYEALGMSELSTFISSSPTVPPRTGAIGKPQAGRSVVVLPVDGGLEPLPSGEIGLLAAHRSDPGLMLRYWSAGANDAAVFHGDWFCGGDLVHIDEDGYVYHHGRADDLMNAQGYRVSPLEIEAVMARAPSVSDCAAVELQVRPDVSVIGAFVVLNEGVQGDADELLAHARSQLAAYKVPKKIVFVSSLPQTANGKVQRGVLRAQYGQTEASAGPDD